MKKTLRLNTEPIHRLSSMYHNMIFPDKPSANTRDYLDIPIRLYILFNAALKALPITIEETIDAISHTMTLLIDRSKIYIINWWVRYIPKEFLPIKSVIQFPILRFRVINIITKANPEEYIIVARTCPPLDLASINPAIMMPSSAKINNIPITFLSLRILSSLILQIIPTINMWGVYIQIKPEPSTKTRTR